MAVIVVNFAHPLTVEQTEQIIQKTGLLITAVHDISCQFDNEQPFASQVTRVVDNTPLTAAEWQTEALLINPPAYAPATTVLLAELHGRIGYFPSFIRIRPIPDSAIPRFEVAEIINLQEVREEARSRRQ